MRKSLLIIVCCLLSLHLHAQSPSLTSNLEASFISGFGSVEYVTFNPTGNKVAVGAYNGNISIWDVETKKMGKVLKGHTEIVNHLAFSKDGRLLASASDDGTVKIWDMETGTIIRDLANAIPNALFRQAYFVVFTPDESKVIFGGKNKKLYVATVRGKEKPLKIFESRFNITTAVIAPDNYFLVVGVGKEILFMNLVDYKIEKKIENIKAYINDVQFSNNGQTLAAWCQSGHMKMWSYPSLKIIKSFKAGEKGEYSHIAFSKDDQMVVSGDTQANFKVWDANKHELLLEMEGHRGSVRTFQFSPNGNYLVSGSYDGSVNLWQLTRTVPIAKPKPTPPPPKPAPKPVVTAPPVPKPIEKPAPAPIVKNELKGRAITTKTTIKVYNSKVILQVWDDKRVDGDIISLYLNDDCVLTKHSLTRQRENVSVVLEPYVAKSLVLYAHNLGQNPPNTAALLVVDGEKKHKIELSGDLKKSEAVNLVFHPEKK